MMGMANFKFRKLKFSEINLTRVYKSVPAERLWLLWWPAAILLIAFCGYYLHQAVDKLDKELRYTRAAKDWAQLISNEARQLKLGQVQQRPMDSLAARQAVEASLQKLNLSQVDIRVDVNNPGLIELSFGNVHFNTWIRWVEVLFNDSRIALKSARVVQIGQGMVKVEAKLVY